MLSEKEYNIGKPITPEVRYPTQDAQEREIYRRGPLERLLGTFEIASRKTIKGYFRGLTRIRCLNPNLKSLFPFEEAYFGNYTEAGDPKDPKTWRYLKKEGVDAEQMYILYLQDKYVIPEKVLVDFAFQATTEENMNSWLGFNLDIQDRLRKYLYRKGPTALFDGIAKGILSTVTQNSDVAPFLLGGGLGASALKIDAHVRQGELGNHLSRMGDEFALLLQVHHRTHERSLAEFRGFPAEQIPGISQRIFLGSRLEFERKDVKTQAVAVGAGVGAAQTLEAVNSASLASAIFNLVMPGMGALIYYKIYRSLSGERAEEYIEEQDKLTAAVDAVTSEVLSQRGRKVSVDLYNTLLPQKRESIGNTIRKNKKRARLPVETAPWWITGGIVAGNEVPAFSDYDEFAGPLVTTMIIGNAIAPLINEEYTTQRAAEVRKNEIARLVEFEEAIETSDYVTPTYLDFRNARESLGLPEIKTHEEALRLMKGPLVIEQLHSGSRRRRVHVPRPIICNPGISFVDSINGGGKSQLGRLLTLEEGIVANCKIKKGCDFRQIDPSLLSEVAYHVEAIPPSVETTIAEQMAAFIKDKDDNFYKDQINAIAERYKLIYGEEMINGITDALFSEGTKREELLENWFKNPLGDEVNDSLESLVTSRLLTQTFLQHSGDYFHFIKTIEDAAEFLKRKPGALKGTSTGEAMMLELIKAFSKKRAFVFLDEPTGNFNSKSLSLFVVEEEQYESYLIKFARLVNSFVEACPDAVIIINSNDSGPEEALKNKPHLLDKLFFNTRNEDLIVWHAKRHPYAQKEDDTTKPKRRIIWDDF